MMDISLDRERVVEKLPMAHTLSVFLVEPSVVQARFIIEALKSIGVERIQVFDTALAVLDEMKSTRPGVVISALYLPDMSGTELVYAMRDNPRTADVAFVLISSETRPQVLEPVRQSGACGILPKPFTSQQLQKVLSTTLDYLTTDNTLLNQHVELEDLVVLVVDDSKISRNYVRHVFENLGIKNFVEVEHGLDAVKIMQNTVVDLVITDYNMPEMDGLELVQYIRGKSWQNSVPILMVTSEQSHNRLAGVEELGVSGICDKPFVPEVIKPLLMKILSEHSH